MFYDQSSLLVTVTPRILILSTKSFDSPFSWSVQKVALIPDSLWNVSDGLCKVLDGLEKVTGGRKIVVEKVICIAQGHNQFRITVFLRLVYLRFLLKCLIVNFQSKENLSFNSFWHFLITYNLI